MEKKDPKDYNKIKIVMMFILKYYPELYEDARLWINNHKKLFTYRHSSVKFFGYFSEMAKDIINKDKVCLMTSQYYSFIVENFILSEKEEEDYTRTSKYFFNNRRF